MKFLYAILSTLFVSMATSAFAGDGNTQCALAEGLTLQVLGSGGPIADDGRASTAYLLWVNGLSRFQIDAGGGSFVRFGQTGARFEDLSHIAISHFHTDHSTDLVALLKSGYFSNRRRGLSISGPAGGGDYPGMGTYLDRMIGPENGAYAYLAGYLDGSAGLVELEWGEIDSKIEKASLVYTDPGDEIEITAMGVPHGPVPALAYRIRIGRQSIVFAGDHNGGSKALVDFAREVDILVMHLPVPEGTVGVGRKLHAPPGVIGDIAASTGARKLVLSHFMARSLKNMETSLAEIRSRYTGSLVIADDLACIGF